MALAPNEGPARRGAARSRPRRVRGRRDALEVELADRRDVREDAGQLARHALDLLVGELEPRESRDVADLVAIDHPVTATPR